MKRLEGEVLEAVADLGGQEALSLEGHTVDPHQFLGMEVNPRAAAIAELVVWLGFLQWHFRIRGGAPAEPILKDFRTITAMDAVLAHDGRELVRDENGRPVKTSAPSPKNSTPIARPAKRSIRVSRSRRSTTSSKNCAPTRLSPLTTSGSRAKGSCSS